MPRFSSSIWSVMVAISLAGAFPTQTVAQILFRQVESLDQAASRASIIAVARLDEYVGEPEEVDIHVQNARLVTGSAELQSISSVRVRGTYTFTIVDRIKGNPAETFKVQLPRIVAYWLMDMSEPQIPIGGKYLLLLTGDATRGFVAAHQALPLVRISEKVELPKAPADGKLLEPVTVALRLLVDSLADPELQHSVAFVLRDSQNDIAVSALKVFLNDPDDRLQECALTSAATNQDPTVIPRIVAFDQRMRAANKGAATPLLDRYNTPAVIPYLNPLIVPPTPQGVRLSAIMTLNRFPEDKSSIPFYMKGIHDAQRQVAFISYRNLHRLVPELGPFEPYTSFLSHHDDEIQKIEGWWAAQPKGD